MKIICVGRNYAEHALEMNNPVPEKPLLFMKPSTAVLKDGKNFYHPEFSSNIHYEAEVVLKICKNGKHIAPQFAGDYFTEVTLGLDLTARDLQQLCKDKKHPWEIAKSFDHSAVIGTFLPLAELNDPQNIGFSLQQNGKEVQRGQTADMLFDFSTLIAEISTYFTLQLGDLIFTGTPVGVGQISIGDTFKGYIEEKEVLTCKIK